MLCWGAGLALAGMAALALVIAIALSVAYPNLPDISDLSDYRPKLPLRIYTSDGALIGEFGEERRNLTPIREIPQIMKNAVLSIEDARFYKHGGVDYLGVIRAGLANVGRLKSQGASTITMQVARNVYLSSEKTYTRKIYEILLTFKLEHMLTKDQISTSNTSPNTGGITAISKPFQSKPGLACTSAAVGATGTTAALLAWVFMTATSSAAAAKGE